MAHPSTPPQAHTPAHTLSPAMSEHDIGSVPLRPLFLGHNPSQMSESGLSTYSTSVHGPMSSTQRLLDAEEGSGAPSRPGTPNGRRQSYQPNARRSLHVQFGEYDDGAPRISAWHRFCGKGQRSVPTLWESFVSLRSHTSVNLLFVFLPLAWASHLVHVNSHEYFGAPVRFTLNLLAIIPLQKRFEWLGDEMIPYVGADLGELLIITLSNAVEGALAIGLLARDNYRLLQITVIGVVLLHVLLIPGVAFVTGGAQIIEQELHSGKTQLNHTLLTLGVMALVLPAAFFAALDRGSLSDLTKYVTRLGNATMEGEIEDEELKGHVEYAALLSDERRGQFLQLSRGLAVLLLLAYICARIYLHYPPKNGTAALQRQSSVLRQRALKKEDRESSVNPWFGVGAIVLCVALMSVTAQFLITSLEEILEHSHISEEWFGLIVLPFISFAGDAFLSLMHFTKRWRRPSARHAISHEPEGVASGISIDLSIQFLLVWMPIFVLVAWTTHKPLLLLFDLLEVAVVVAACFLVNFVTADAKTNWAEGAAMIFFYVMIGLVSWFYPGQVEVRMFVGRESVAHAVFHGPTLDG
ncbi:hypothetical protein EXIGLDRAFT_830117 [Exidia glandulosa HHB12029]|uniref:Sodium/calcium exchanger membrane region domain-containing protein n=1 Tax=Exidia glandulosa HHB12029 TaxID=1314781 RepID=A0A165NYM9_EXIGL|nr:hypothetical protein EXIGLDRAFT_830117 [Exidia glandulosa HHB12029]